MLLYIQRLPTYLIHLTNSKIDKMYFIPGKSLSASGYHLCIRNETSIMSFLVMHKVPYTVTKPCGGWLLWKTCTVTLYRMTYQTEYKTVMKQVTRCCEGYVQVGSYCALRECTAPHSSIYMFEDDRKHIVLFGLRVQVSLYKCL